MLSGMHLWITHKWKKRIRSQNGAFVSSKRTSRESGCLTYIFGLMGRHRSIPSERKHILSSPLFFKVCMLLLTLCELVSYNPHKVAVLVSIKCMRPLLLASAGEDLRISYYISHYFPSTEIRRLTRPYYAPLDTYGWYFKEQIKSLKSSFPMGRLSSFPCVNKVGRSGRSARKSCVRVKSQFSSVFVYLSVCLSVF